MSHLPDFIVYIWLAPLALYAVIPLLVLAIYLLGRFIHFMLFPKRVLQEEQELDVPAGEFENIR